ncbi:MAG: ATP-binding protein [Aestuariivita sp.]|nr:ATP-binding protein [Aestuariivita sp.]
MIDGEGALPIEQHEIVPNANALIESLRDIGYNLSSALADIVDNSLTAQASKVSIRVDVKSENAAVAIIDNGIGMSRDEILNAMRPGSRSPAEIRDKSDLGRFGLGLKTASFSQCRRLTVLSRRGKSVYAATWDLDLVVEKNAWIVEGTKKINGIRFAELLVQDGTMVLWEKIDRVGLQKDSSTFIRLVDDATRHLELVFHRFMKVEPGYKPVVFDVNGRDLVPVDPFVEWHDATIRRPVDRRVFGTGTVTIQPYILPHRNKVATDREWRRMGLAQGHMRSQGFYLYRNRRLIRHATWFRLAPKHRLTQLARVRIDIGNESDADWKIDILKASASPPSALREHLRLLIGGLGERSRRVYRKRGTKLTDENPLPLWQRIKIDSRIAYDLNQEHPAIANFESSLSDEQVRTLRSVLRLICASLPLEALYHDMADNYSAMEQNSLDEQELLDVGRQLIEQLIEFGNECQDIESMIKKIPPFSTNIPIVAKLINEVRPK